MCQAFQNALFLSQQEFLFLMYIRNCKRVFWHLRGLGLIVNHFSSIPSSRFSPLTFPLRGSGWERKTWVHTIAGEVSECQSPLWHVGLLGFFSTQDCLLWSIRSFATRDASATNGFTSSKREKQRVKSLRCDSFKCQLQTFWSIMINLTEFQSNSRYTQTGIAAYPQPSSHCYQRWLWGEGRSESITFLGERLHAPQTTGLQEVSLFLEGAAIWDDIVFFSTNHRHHFF